MANRPVERKKKVDDKKLVKDKKDAKIEEQKRNLPKNQRSFEQEITLLPDTTIQVMHSKNTKRLMVVARTENGKLFKLKYRKIGSNGLKITNKVDSAQKLKITITPKEPLDNKGWYKTTQSLARLLMMVRNVGISYRSQYGMALPGFRPTIGAAFGQTRNIGVMSPGLDFAFGTIDDSYIDKALRNNWLVVERLYSYSCHH